MISKEDRPIISEEGRINRLLEALETEQGAKKWDDEAYKESKQVKSGEKGSPRLQR